MKILNLKVSWEKENKRDFKCKENDSVLTSSPEKSKRMMDRWMDGALFGMLRHSVAEEACG